VTTGRFHRPTTGGSTAVVEWASFVAVRCNRMHLWHGLRWLVAFWPHVQAAAAVTSRDWRAQTAAGQGEGQREYSHVRPHPWVHSDLPEVVHGGLATRGRSRKGDARRSLPARAMRGVAAATPVCTGGGSSTKSSRWVRRAE
jgi:hypothetical protein